MARHESRSSDEWIVIEPGARPHEEVHRCPRCRQYVMQARYIGNKLVCPSCGLHARVGARDRIAFTVDPFTFTEWDPYLSSVDPLEFPGYAEKLESARQSTRLQEAVVCGEASIGGIRTAICAMDPNFIMGSMGSVVGEKVARALERAARSRLPLIMFTTSGGARMQEGLYSLMQMAKTSMAVGQLSEAGMLYITVLCDPTTGGVTASFATQADIILTEPEALIGFAGRRVVEATTRERLPEDFQSAEAALANGQVDAIVHRHDMKRTLTDILALHGYPRISMPTSNGGEAQTGTVYDKPVVRRDHVRSPGLMSRIFGRRERRRALKDAAQIMVMAPAGAVPETHADVDDAEAVGSVVARARSLDRPTARYFLEELFDDFIELHGDRISYDDPAIITGIALFEGTPVTVIAQEKGVDTKDRIHRNFGSARPEGYRKAIRAAKLAERFSRPVITLIDTQGAYCDLASEQHNQGGAIAESLLVFSSLKTSTIAVLIGEGGSGGALAFGLVDRMGMLERSIYSVVSPEGCAQILYKDSSRAPEAARHLNLTAKDALRIGAVDTIIAEGDPGEKGLADTLLAVSSFLEESLDQLAEERLEETLVHRYRKFRSIGEFEEPEPSA